MAWKVDKRIPEDLFIKLMIEKANVIKDHLKNSIDQLIYNIYSCSLKILFSM